MQRHPAVGSDGLDYPSRLRSSKPGSQIFETWLSDLRNLVEVELDRRFPAEDRHEHLELLLVGVDLADRGRQGGERAVGDGDGVADLEVEDLDLGLGAGLLLLLD